MRAPLALVLIGGLCLVACGDDPAPPLEPPPPAPPVPMEVVELARTSIHFDGQISGSGVYVGDGLVLSNWHVVVASAIYDNMAHALGTDIPSADYLTTYTEGQPSSMPVAGAISPDDVYCLTASTASVAARYQRLDRDTYERPPGDTLCTPVLSIELQRAWPTWFAAGFPSPDASLPLPRLAWTDMALDLSISRIPTGSITAYAGELPHIPVGFDAPLAADQLVWVIGYPASILSRIERHAVIELCRIVDPEVRSVRDPDRQNPSELEVPSFTIDCASIEPGSSGSPVIDVETGVLLGLVWTEDFFGYGYVSAASAWKTYAEAKAGDPSLGALADLVRRDAQ